MATKWEMSGDFWVSSELAAMGIICGDECLISKKASIYGAPTNIKLGSRVRICDFVIITATGSFEFGDGVHISPFCNFGARFGIKIGSHTSFAHGVKVYSSADDYSGERKMWDGFSENFAGVGKSVEIGSNCIIGANSVILPGCVFESGVALGALSLAKGYFSGFGVYGGVPARFLKERKKDFLA